MPLACRIALASACPAATRGRSPSGRSTRPRTRRGSARATAGGRATHGFELRKDDVVEARRGRAWCSPRRARTPCRGSSGSGDRHRSAGLRCAGSRAHPRQTALERRSCRRAGPGTPAGAASRPPSTPGTRSARRAAARPSVAPFSRGGSTNGGVLPHERPERLRQRPRASAREARCRPCRRSAAPRRGSAPSSSAPKCAARAARRREAADDELLLLVHLDLEPAARLRRSS